MVSNVRTNTSASRIIDFVIAAMSSKCALFWAFMISSEHSSMHTRCSRLQRTEGSEREAEASFCDWYTLIGPLKVVSGISKEVISWERHRKQLLQSLQDALL